MPTPLAPATQFLGRNGEILHHVRGDDYQWRWPIPLSQMPDFLVQSVVAMEDRNFYNHIGIDLAATVRAGGQLLVNRRIISGASTIPMQLARIRCGRFQRSWGAKFCQMIQGVKLDWQLSKEQILEEYLNLLPYGGKIYGIEAASRYYFGRSPEELNRGEISLLVGVPQRPNAFRPDRHLAAALKRREIVLAQLQIEGIITAGEAAEIVAEPLRFRDFSQVWPIQMTDPQFFQLLIQKEGFQSKRSIQTSLDPLLQQAVHRILQQKLLEHPSIPDAAAVVMQNATGEVLALIGTMNYASPRAGQVNAATAVRSPGSALKPFIYGEALQGGLLVADTILLDSPLALKEYRPGNFDGTFRGEVRAEVALSDSLNTPVIRLLETLGTQRIYQVLSNFGILETSAPPPEKIGLSLALGGVGCQLLNLTNAYRCIARGGMYSNFTLLKQSSASAERMVWYPGTCALLLKMMRFRPLTGAEDLPIAWKTGTSNGNCDAWCFAIMPEYTIGVWLGDKTGSPIPELVGGEVAAPVAGMVARRIFRHQAVENWSEAENCLELVSLCRTTGLAPGDGCNRLGKGWAVKNIPLLRCSICNENSDDCWQILQPRSGNYVLQSGKERSVLPLQTTCQKQLEWFLNGRYLGQVDTLEVKCGSYRLRAWDGKRSREIKFQVTPAP